MSVVVRGPARMLELASWLAEDGVSPGGLPVLRAKNLFAMPRDSVQPPPPPPYIYIELIGLVCTIYIALLQREFIVKYFL